MTDAVRGELGALWNIVKTLADGKFHSGEELGALLGVSRAAVWKHLQKLENFGVILSSIKGRGYCINGGLDLLDLDIIKTNSHTISPLDIQIFPQIDSTNSFLMRQDNPAMKVCFAEFQSAGRGRRGRSWVSPMAQNIYCSIGWGFEGGAAAVEGLSLAIGLSIVRALKRFGLTGLNLKWPNDVLYQNKKLAGILIEMRGDPAGYCQIVIGIGLNVSMQEQQGQSIDQPWIALNSILADENLLPVTRSQLASALLDELMNVLQGYHETGFANYQREWVDVAAYKGQKVELRNGQSLVFGTFIGVTDSGALQVATETGIQVYHGGEISLRAAQ